MKMTTRAAGLIHYGISCQTYLYCTTEIAEFFRTKVDNIAHKRTITLDKNANNRILLKITFKYKSKRDIITSNEKLQNIEFISLNIKVSKNE